MRLLKNGCLHACLLTSRRPVARGLCSQRVRARRLGVRAAAVPGRIRRLPSERGDGARDDRRVGAFLPRLRQGPVRFLSRFLCSPDAPAALGLSRFPPQGWHSGKRQKIAPGLVCGFIHAQSVPCAV